MRFFDSACGLEANLNRNLNLKVDGAGPVAPSTGSQGPARTRSCRFTTHSARCELCVYALRHGVDMYTAKYSNRD